MYAIKSILMPVQPCATNNPTGQWLASGLKQDSSKYTKLTTNSYWFILQIITQIRLRFPLSEGGTVEPKVPPPPPPVDLYRPLARFSTLNNSISSNLCKTSGRIGILASLIQRLENLLVFLVQSDVYGKSCGVEAINKFKLCVPQA